MFYLTRKNLHWNIALILYTAFLFQDKKTTAILQTAPALKYWNWNSSNFIFSLIIKVGI